MVRDFFSILGDNGLPGKVIRVRTIKPYTHMWLLDFHLIIVEIGGGLGVSSIVPNDRLRFAGQYWNNLEENYNSLTLIKSIAGLVRFIPFNKPKCADMKQSSRLYAYLFCTSW